jgi:sensor histidine kinase YesM
MIIVRIDQVVIDFDIFTSSIRVLLQIVVFMPFAIFLLILIIRVMSRRCVARFLRFVLRLKECIKLKSNVGACAEQQCKDQPIAKYRAMDQYTESYNK